MTLESPKLKTYAVLFTLARDWRKHVEHLLKKAEGAGITKCGLMVVVGGYDRSEKETLRSQIEDQIKPRWQRPDVVEVHFPDALQGWGSQDARNGFLELSDVLRHVISHVIRRDGENRICLIWNAAYPEWAAAGTLTGIALSQVSWIDPPSDPWIYPDVQALQLKNAIRHAGGDHSALDGILGASEPIVELKRKIELLAVYPFPVLLIGETGTGKELVARAIHQESGVSKKLSTLNAALLDPALAESKLFGHKKGAFTGADTDYKGRLLEAEGSTFFLDELNRLPLSAQGHLLRALNDAEEGFIEIEPVGSTGDKIRRIKARLITACQRDPLLHEDIPPDLYYRVAGLVLHVPPLRERGDDIRLLAEDTIERINTTLGIKGPRRISKNALRKLKDHPWPGNVRELKQALRQAWVTAHGKGQTIITTDELVLSARASSLTPWRTHGGDIKRWLARQALAAAEEAKKAHPENKAAAARALGLEGGQALDRFIMTYTKDLQESSDDT